MPAVPVCATPALNCLPANKHSTKEPCADGVSISEIIGNSVVLGRVGVLMPTLAMQPFGQ